MFFYLTDLIADYFCPLSQSSILKTVLNIAAEQIPEVEVLHLKYNKLEDIKHLSILSKKFPKLKILYINDNKVSIIIWYLIDMIQQQQQQQQQCCIL